MMRTTLSALVVAFALSLAPAVPLQADGLIGLAGPEFEYAPGLVFPSDVAMDASGRFMLVWSDEQHVWGHMYELPATPLGDTFLVAEPPDPDGQIDGAFAAAGPNGPFVATFLSWKEPDFDQTLGFAAYDREGRLLHRDQVVQLHYGAYDVAVGTTGTFLIVWESNSGAGDEIRAQIFSPDGLPAGPSFTLDTGAGQPVAPLLARGANGGYVAFWAEARLEGYAAFARQFDSNGAATSEVISLDVNLGASWWYSWKACVDESGGIVVSWSNNGFAEPWVRRFAPDGTPRGDAFRPAGEDPWYGWSSQLACSPDGAFVVVWDGDIPSGEFARRYDATGAPDSPVFRVNEAAQQGYFYANTAVDAAGNFVITWQGGVGPHHRTLGRAFRVQPPPKAKGDFDGDGHADLVLRPIAGGPARVWTMLEAIRTQDLTVYPQTPDWQWQLGGVDDFNGDGHADLVFRQQTTGDVDVWLMGGTFGVDRIGWETLTGAPLPSPDWIIAATADFDRDGQPDLMWRNVVTNKLEIWLLDGTVWRATRVPSPDHAVDGNWEVVAASDLDMDGYTDLLWYNVTSGRVVQWLLDAELTRRTGRFTTPAAAGDNSWKVVAAADYGFGLLGQPGTTDIVWRNETTGKLVVWFMDTAGVRTSGTFTSPDAPSDPLAFTVVGPR